MAGKEIIVLGGGIGGVAVSDRLRRLLPPEHRITVIDKSPDHIFLPSLPWVATGYRRPAGIKRSLRRLENKGISFINQPVSTVGVAERTVTAGGEERRFDYLVMSLGADLYPENITGLSEAAHFFYTLTGAEALKEALSDFKGGKVVILIPGMPYKCPAAPYECAMLLHDYFDAKNIRYKVEISIYSVEPHPLPVAGPLVGGKVTDLIKDRDIDATFNAKTAQVDKTSRQVRFEGGEVVDYDLLIAVPPHSSPAVVKEAGLANEAGWVPVDPGDLSTVHKDIYAIGDITAIKLPNGMLLPKAGALAHGQAEVVAANIAAVIKHEATTARFDGIGSCFMEMGKGKGTMAVGDFYAEPDPQVKVRNPGHLWHWAKVAYERYWLWRMF